MSTLAPAISGVTDVISSVDLLAIINEVRRSERPPSSTLRRADFRHDNFMAKIASVLGPRGAPQFSGSQINEQNKQKYLCYFLPRREACLMVMSESYEVQARVYDRMIELQVATPGQDVSLACAGVLSTSVDISLNDSCALRDGILNDRF